jgi:hypothetical protein
VGLAVEVPVAAEALENRVGDARQPGLQRQLTLENHRQLGVLAGLGDPLL